MSDDISDDDLLQSWLTNQESLATEDYLKRGRRFKDEEIGILKERWVVLHREMYNYDQTNKVERNDVAVEIELRGEEPPREMIEKEHEAFAERLRDDMERIDEGEIPDWYEKMARDLDIEVADFLRQLKKPSN